MFSARTHQAFIPIGARRRHAGLLVGVAAAVSLFTATGAQAQNCGTLTLVGPGGSVPNSLQSTGSGISGANAIQGVVTAANTAFLTQSTAFVSAPGNPAPNSEGGGVWVRSVGGELTLNSTTQVNGSMIAPPASGPLAGTYQGSTTCSSQFHQTYAGVQLGQDIAELNVSGWNLHFGTTAGYLESKGSIVGGNLFGGVFDSTTQAPFAGVYGAATYGGFFVDGLVRLDYYQNDLNSPTAHIFDQKVDARGVTVAFSTGYNWKVPDSNWFVEPSAGLVLSRESVDPINTSSPNPGGGTFFAAGNYSGTTNVDGINSSIGRLGLRVGTTVETTNAVFQPFASISVWHDFAGTITSNYASCTNCFFVNGAPSVLAANMSTTNVGTFEQYSLGISGQIKNTGWLGFVRVDYRDGSQLQGWDGVGGIRYQFTPEGAPHPALPVKAPVYKAPITEAVNWTGFYIGAFGGADFGRSELDAIDASADIHPAGALLGGTVGYNYQTGRYVFGIEGDGAWTNLTGSAQCSPLITGLTSMGFSANSPPFFQTTCHDDMSWITTVAGRAGYLVTPRTLLYVKGGAAWENQTWSVTCNLGPFNGFPSPGFGPTLIQACSNPASAFLNYISATDNRIGGLIGWGTEFALTQHWSAKAEYDWIDFGTKTLTASDGTVFTAKQTVSEVKIGVNYHFDGGPVIAKY